MNVVDEVIVRFLAKVAVVVDDDSCWLWTATQGGGYGMFRFAGRMQPAHRVAWVLDNGAIPDGLDVLHSCDVKLCVRPTHLYLGTHGQNMRDARNRNRIGAQKLTWEKVEEIRRRSASGETQSSIASDYSVDPSLISHIIHRRAWRE